MLSEKVLDLSGASRINVTCEARMVPRFVQSMYANGYVMGNARVGGFFVQQQEAMIAKDVGSGTEVELVFVRDADAPLESSEVPRG